MKVVSYFSQIFCIVSMLFCSSNLSASETCIGPEMDIRHVNSPSFTFKGSTQDSFRFTIFNTKKTTDFHLTAFSKECITGIFVFKLDSNNCFDSYYLNSIQPDNVKSVIIDESQYPYYKPQSIAMTYSLTNGEYFVRIYDNPEACMNEIIFSGNTGQYGIDPCEHLFIYSDRPTNFPYYQSSNNKFLVTSPLNCPWKSLSNNDWIMITQGNSNTGPGLVNYTVSKNMSEQKRNGTLLIWNKVFNIEQEEHRRYLPFIPLLTTTTNN